MPTSELQFMTARELAAACAEKSPAKYDVANGTIEIFGIRYSVDLFRALAFHPIGGAFRIVARDGDGVVTLQRIEAPAPTE